MQGKIVPSIEYIVKEGKEKKVRGNSIKLGKEKDGFPPVNLLAGLY